jgi:hypothetical protein
MTDDARSEGWLSDMRGTRPVDWNGLLGAIGCSFILFLLIVPGINLLVDPKGLYQLVRIEGFNLYKPFQPDFTAEVKALRARRYRPDTLVFGASTVTFGVDSECRPARAPGVSRIYNYGGVGGSAHGFVSDLPDLTSIGSVRRVLLEARFESQHFVPTEPVRTPVDTETPPADAFTDLVRRWMPARYATTYIKNLFSWSEFALSVETVLANRKSDKSFLFRGFGENGSYDQEWLRRWGASVITEQNLLGHVSNYTDHLLNRTANDMHADFGYVDQAAAAAQRNGIALDMFIPPVHATELILIREGGIWPLYERFKTDLLRRVDEARSRYSANIRLFDFGTLSLVTTQSIKQVDPNDVHEPFSDPVHFKKNVGDLILAVMLKCGDGPAIPDGFGRELDRSSIVAHLLAEKSKLEAYESAHPELVRKIAEVIGQKRKRPQ